MLMSTYTMGEKWEAEVCVFLFNLVFSRYGHAGPADGSARLDTEHGPEPAPSHLHEFIGMCTYIHMGSCVTDVRYDMHGYMAQNGCV